MPFLSGDYADFRNETTRLSGILASTSTLAPIHRKFIAEIALLRLAILIENSMKSVFCKLACGATYIDGTAPLVVAVQKNGPLAVAAMHNYNRTKRRNALPWNDGAEIRENIRLLIDPNDPCHQLLKNHATFLTEIRWLRNHIAHRNKNSRLNFVKLIRKYYGANVSGVTCGNILVSPRVSQTRPLLETYILTSNVMMKDIMRA
jgi:hypothetical protein